MENLELIKEKHTTRRIKNLTFDEIQEIKKLYKSGADINFLSKKFNRNCATIFRVLRKHFSQEQILEIKESKRAGKVLPNRTEDLLIKILAKLEYFENRIKAIDKALNL